MSTHQHPRRGTRCGRSTVPPDRETRMPLHRYPPLPATSAHIAHREHQLQYEGTRTMLDRTQVDATIYRVAIASFTHYPDKHIKEPGYTIDEDLDWCMRPLRHLPPEQRGDLRAQILQLITEPTADRQAFIGHLHSLSSDT